MKRICLGGARSWLPTVARGLAVVVAAALLGGGGVALADEPTTAPSPESAPAGGMAVMVPVAPAETGPHKMRFFGAGARVRFVTVPRFVLGLIGLQDALGTFQEGFSIDLGYRSMRLESGRKKGGFDIGLSFFWDDSSLAMKRVFPRASGMEGARATALGLCVIG